MEEKTNMTAERSLEIITEQIERSRYVVAKDTGLSLYISGLCTMSMALLIGILIYLTSNTAWYLLYVLLPVVIFATDRYAKRGRPKAPTSIVGSMVDKTWQTFGIFVFAYFVFGILYNMLMAHFEHPDVYSRLAIHPLRVVLLLFIWESFYVTQTLTGWMVYYTSAHYVGIAHGIIPALIVTLLSFIGLTLPGLKLK